MYVLTASGGMWKTDKFFTSGNSSLEWQPMSDYLATTSGGSIALGLTTEQTVYFASGDPYGYIGLGGVFYKSVDGGMTWGVPLILSGFIYDCI